mmetsp:Transcript_72951/g.202414  ORF Transcript_72951/g.202414 Transcript_72951/m.202414 type:complete len:218 (-) Transcript_72951:1307-1960(-)
MMAVKASPRACNSDALGPDALSCIAPQALQASSSVIDAFGLTSFIDPFGCGSSSDMDVVSSSAAAAVFPQDSADEQDMESKVIPAIDASPNGIDAIVGKFSSPYTGSDVDEREFVLDTLCGAELKVEGALSSRLDAAGCQHSLDVNVVADLAAGVRVAPSVDVFSIEAPDAESDVAKAVNASPPPMDAAFGKVSLQLGGGDVDAHELVPDTLSNSAP